MRIATLVTLALLVLAGCADDAPAGVDDDFKDHDLKATETTGVIRGVVVNEMIVPIEGATIRLGADGPETTSNADGQFGFSQVDPGIQILHVDRLGYQAVQHQTEVVAGVARPPVITVQLLSEPSELPRVESLSFQGFIMCSMSTPAYRVAVCSLPNIVREGTIEEEFMMTHEGLEADPWHIQSEMVWDSTQAAGDYMMYTMEHSVLAGGEIAPSSAGPSPLLIAADRAMIEEGPYAGQIIHRVFNFEHSATTPPTPVCGVPNPVHGGTMCVKGWGATVEQKFEIFTHVFYRFAPQEGWRFSADGAPVVPPV